MKTHVLHFLYEDPVFCHISIVLNNSLTAWIEFLTNSDFKNLQSSEITVLS